MKWLTKHEASFKRIVKVFNEYASLYPRQVDFGSGIKVSVAEIQVIETIIDNPELKLIELANELRISAPAITKHVNKLENKGLVTKYRLPDNKKEFRLRISSLGENVYGNYQQYAYDNLFVDLFAFFDEANDNFEGNLTRFFTIFEQSMNDFRNDSSLESNAEKQIQAKNAIDDTVT